MIWDDYRVVFRLSLLLILSISFNMFMILQQVRMANNSVWS